MKTTNSKYKVCRRLGNAVYEKCATPKFALAEQKRRMQRSGRRPKALSEYGKQLLEKQKLRLSYGLKEKKLKEYIFIAINSPEDTFTKLYQQLETRLDSLVYKLGITKTRAMARQCVSHGHICINGRKLNIPSYQVKAGDIVSVREGSKNVSYIANLHETSDLKPPKWIDFDYKVLSGKVLQMPELEETAYDFQKIVEFYTR